MTQSLSDWALPQLSRLLPLDDDSLKQIITYTETLEKPAAAEHLKNLLGDSPQALEFISSFQSRRPAPQAESTPASSNPASRDVSESEVPRARPRKKKQPLFNKLPPPRQIEQHGEVAKGYLKKNEDDDYIAGSSKKGKHPTLSSTLTLQSEPDALQLPVASSSNASHSRSPVQPKAPQPNRLPPSAAGTLISDGPSSNKASRSASPANASKQPSKAKVSVSGGMSMRGASATLSDLDSAIRTLELQTNPTLHNPSTSGISAEEELKRRRCNCMAQRHPLLAAAPNCLSCGKIVCLKEGLGPCTFCGKPLLAPADLQAMIRTLRDERGREKMQVNNAAHRRAEVSQAPRAFAGTSSPATPEGGGSSDDNDGASPDGQQRLAAAKAHRDRLLRFQEQNARRTTIRDEAADFSTPDEGQSLWATPQERALQLKRQQKALREQEWAARPEWEKRRVVVSLDVKGGRAVRKMAAVERPATPESGDDDADADGGNAELGGTAGDAPSSSSGKFSRNPLLGGLIRPVFQPKGKGKAEMGDEGGPRATWRRVQDDNEDNEQWILDGGAYGEEAGGQVVAGDEPDCG